MWGKNEIDIPETLFSVAYARRDERESPFGGETTRGTTL